jgi:hypothetical protein
MRALQRIEPGLLRQPDGARRPRAYLLGLATLALIVIGVFVTSGWPDGIQKMAPGSGISSRRPGWFAAPMADYQLRFFATPWVPKVLAGLAGLSLVYLLCRAVGHVLSAAGSASDEEGA